MQLLFEVNQSRCCATTTKDGDEVDDGRVCGRIAREKSLVEEPRSLCGRCNSVGCSTATWLTCKAGLVLGYARLRRLERKLEIYWVVGSLGLLSPRHSSRRILRERHALCSKIVK